jgi:hypothetical protein
MEELCRSLRQQHSFDLEVYQSSHQEWKNRRLHQILIPVECFSAVLFLTCICFRALPLSEMQRNVLPVCINGWGMGMIALIISPAEHPWTGIASFWFFFGSAWISCLLVTRYDPSLSMQIIWITFISWSLASFLQVVLGHWFWELNEPDVVNSDRVSLLSLTHAVQVAWSS